MNRTNGIRVLGGGLYEVPSFTNPRKTYVVDVREHTCTCPGFQYRGKCKHLKLVEKQQRPRQPSLMEEIPPELRVPFNGVFSEV